MRITTVPNSAYLDFFDELESALSIHISEEYAYENYVGGFTCGVRKAGQPTLRMLRRKSFPAVLIPAWKMNGLLCIESSVVSRPANVKKSLFHYSDDLLPPRA